MQSERRFVCILAGTQSGKTSLGPHWLYREIQRHGPGDYLIVTPTFPLMELKVLPAVLYVFQTLLRLGHYRASARYFIFDAEGSQKAFGDRDHGRQPTRVLFGSAINPESLESATVKAAWLDEAGQTRFRQPAWEAVLRRLSLARGRVLITTTPYNLGWLKQQVYDRWARGDPAIEVVNFESVLNPNFSREEFEDARSRLPAWKFNMFYRGLFERPAGLIYDAFDFTQHKVPRFAIPAHWNRYVGLDFGGAHTAAVFYAREPKTGRLFLYRTYKAGGRSIAEHARALLAGEPSIPVCVGGSPSEEQWRREFGSAGLPVRGPRLKDVEVGIDRVYAAHRRGEIIVFDDLADYLDEKAGYSREVDEAGDPTDRIENKEDFHLMDAERYIVGYLRTPHAAVSGPGPGRQERERSKY